VAVELPPDLVLTPLEGEGRTLREWLTTFHIALVALDPYTNESSWVLDTAARIIGIFRQADVRVGWLIAADADGARQFLGPLAREFFTLLDPQREAIKALGLERLPALVHIGQDLTVVGAAEGWDPAAWKVITDRLGHQMSWTRPVIPERGDPSPFSGTPALV
jgi:hypothetical protein